MLFQKNILRKYLALLPADSRGRWYAGVSPAGQ